MAENLPEVTVVMPVFNGENYVEAALRSVLTQEGVDFEIVVVDDGSHDAAALRAICESMHDPRIRLFRKANGGVASALNLGIREARGEVVCWLSHDDLFTPDRLSRQWAFWQALNDPRALIFGDYALFEQGKRQRVVSLKYELSLTDDPIAALSRGLVNGCTTMFSTNAVKSAGYFDEALLCTQDYDMWLRLVRLGYRLVHQPEVLAQTRLHPEQTSRVSPVAAHENASLWCRIADELLAQSRDEDAVTTLSRLKQLRHFVEDSQYLSGLGGERIAAHVRNLERALLSGICVSVVVPVKGRPDQTLRALASVITQTHPTIQTVVCNDSESPLEPAIQAELLRMPGATSVVDYDGSHGPGYARNCGLAAATGEYVCFLDSDDLFLPEKVEWQLERMVDDRASFGHTDYIREDLDARHLSVVDVSHHQGGDQVDFIRAFGCEIATPTVMLKTELLAVFGYEDSICPRRLLFPEDIREGEDTIAWLRVLGIPSTRLAHLPAATTIVTVRGDSAANNLERQARAWQAVKAQLHTQPMTRKRWLVRLIYAYMRDSALGAKLRPWVISRGWWRSLKKRLMAN